MIVWPLSGNMGWLLLGQTERLATVTERFQTGGSEISWGLIAGLAIGVAVVAAILWKVARIAAVRDGRSFYSSRRLFNELCRLHELDWPSRRLLRQLARSQKLDHPAQLFLEPARFDMAQGDGGRQQLQDQIAALRERLFTTGPAAEMKQLGS